MGGPETELITHAEYKNICVCVCAYFSGVVPRDSQKYVALSLHHLLCSQTFDADLQKIRC